MTGVAYNIKNSYKDTKSPQYIPEALLNPNYERKLSILKTTTNSQHILLCTVEIDPAGGDL